jgi:anti-sigma factor RsiW
MTHEEAEALFDAYFSGSLEREQVRAFHAHLKDCEDCRSLIRIRGAGTRARRPSADGRMPQDLQAQMARNRSMLFRIVLLLLLAAWIFKVRQ